MARHSLELLRQLWTVHNKTFWLYLCVCLFAGCSDQRDEKNHSTNKQTVTASNQTHRPTNAENQQNSNQSKHHLETVALRLSTCDIDDFNNGIKQLLLGDLNEILRILDVFHKTLDTGRFAFLVDQLGREFGKKLAYGELHLPLPEFKSPEYDFVRASFYLACGKKFGQNKAALPEGILDSPGSLFFILGTLSEAPVGSIGIDSALLLAKAYQSDKTSKTNDSMSLDAIGSTLAKTREIDKLVKQLSEDTQNSHLTVATYVSWIKLDPEAAFLHLKNSSDPSISQEVVKGSLNALATKIDYASAIAWVKTVNDPGWQRSALKTINTFKNESVVGP
jgi:hypothetical protein